MTDTPTKEHVAFTGVTYLFASELNEALPLLEEFNELSEHMDSKDIDLSMLREMVKAGYAAVFIYVKEDSIVGTLGGVVAPDIFGPHRMKAQELFWYVQPGARGKGSIALLDAFEEWARAKGASETTLATLELDPRLDKFYTRRGYTKTEIHYRKTWQE